MRIGQSTTRIVVIVAILAGLGLGGFYLYSALSRPLVQVTQTVRGPVVQGFYATGTVSPEREYSIKAQVAGVLVLEEKIDKGKPVKKNQLLGRVSSDDLQKKMAQADAELKEKRARADAERSPVLMEFKARIEALTEILASTKREHVRLQELAKVGNAREVEIDRAFERVKTTWIELAAAEAQLGAKKLELTKDLEVAQANHGIARWNIDQQEVRSPIDGVILDWPVSSGTRVAVNDLIMTVADVDAAKLVMRAAVDEEDRNNLRPDQLVRMTLYAFPDDPMLGRVKTIYAKADVQRRTFEVDVEFLRDTAGPTRVGAAADAATRPSPYGQLAAGLTGELGFVEQERESCLVLPRQALQGDHFYVVRNGRIERIKADAGVRNVTRVEVRSGIAQGDLVVITPIGKLEVGQTVRTSMVDPRVAADMNNPKDTGIFKGGF